MKATKGFHSIIDTWKRRPDVRLVKAIRHRIQHGAMLDGSLQIKENMKTRRQNKSIFVVVYVLEEDIWNKIVESVDFNTKEFFNESVKAEKDRLHFLVSKYYDSLDSLFGRIDSKFTEIYPSEILKRQTLFRELDEIDKWFKAKGWSRL